MSGGRPPVPVLLAAIDHALRNGSNMTNANLALDLLCEQLGVDRDALAFDPQWSQREPEPGAGLRPSVSGRTAGLLVEVHPVGQPRFVGLAVDNVGPVLLTPDEAARTLRQAADGVERQGSLGPLAS